jgi:putative acetyltransferase
MIIVPGDFADPQIIQLLHLHVERARSASPPCSSHALEPTGLQAPDISFWAAWEADRLLGVGALREIASDYGEVKSMHTAAVARRTGVGSAILRHIIATARRRGYSKLSLETGSSDYFAAAQALYEQHGFTRGGRFGSYRVDPNTVFMHLEL